MVSYLGGSNSMFSNIREKSSQGVVLKNPLSSLLGDIRVSKLKSSRETTHSKLLEKNCPYNIQLKQKIIIPFERPWAVQNTMLLQGSHHCSTWLKIRKPFLKRFIEKMALPDLGAELQSRWQTLTLNAANQKHKVFRPNVFAKENLQLQSSRIFGRVFPMVFNMNMQRRIRHVQTGLNNNEFLEEISGRIKFYSLCASSVKSALGEIVDILERSKPSAAGAGC